MIGHVRARVEMERENPPPPSTPSTPQTMAERLAQDVRRAAA
ncbi:hypothetical protein [Falsiroseomonas tokyonensis]|nr:hypothetical protein [Falsiroseomonas tokyonensis]